MTSFNVIEKQQNHVFWLQVFTDIIIAKPTVNNRAIYMKKNKTRLK